MSNRLESLLDTLKTYHVKADETDHIIPLWLPYTGIILSFIALTVMGIGEVVGGVQEKAVVTGIGELLMGLGLLLLVIAGIAGAIISLYVFYKLIDRLNRHVKRTIVFYSTIADILDEINSPNTINFKTQVNELKITGEERSPVLWIVLAILFPIIIFYVYHFLNKDFAKHSTREYVLLNIINEEFKKQGVPTINPEELYRIPDRSTLLYIILTIITMGLFGFYWIYTLVNDPNNHFKTHKLLEEKIINGFREIVSKTQLKQA